MWKPIQVLVVLLVGCGTCYAADVPEPIVRGGEICYTAADHEQLLGLWGVDLDRLAGAEGDIREMEAGALVLRRNVELSSLHAKKVDLELQIANVKRGGFWRRHFRLCAGIGAGVELMGDDAGSGSLVVFGGLCALP